MTVSTADAPGEESQQEGKIDPVAEAFCEGAERRAMGFMAALCAVTTGVLWVAYGRVVAFGFVLGSAAAGVNFWWLKRVVTGFTAAVSGDARRPSAGLLVFRYLFRFALITMAAFVIFKRSRSSGYGFLIGLFVPVAALMCEAAYETWVAVRRKL